MTLHQPVDTLVIGGGVVGMSLAYGLARSGDAVRVLDGSDDAFRASRGNFGLVWSAGKGAGQPAYARWSLASTAAWPGFAAELTERTGIDLELSQTGGLLLFLNPQDLAESVARHEAIRRQLGLPYPFDVLDNQALRALVPAAGPEVAGAIFSPHDGHVSPLRLLRALFRGFGLLGGELVSRTQVERMEQAGGVFRVVADGQVHEARRLVLAAGLGNKRLAPCVGLRAPVRPQRGQILVTERLQPFLRYPSLHVRQTGEGVVQIGDSHEEVGLDEGTTLEELARIADRAIRYFPVLAGVNMVRSWGALRVMTPDGLPIYQASQQCPGAFVVTCHSGITLAANHAGPLVAWIRGGAEPEDIQGFKVERFNVQTH
ncbi:MAG: NAD(P)/FAD-dependent oxidoreductase [Ramlibacter sp.]